MTIAINVFGNVKYQNLHCKENRDISLLKQKISKEYIVLTLTKFSQATSLMKIAFYL